MSSDARYDSTDVPREPAAIATPKATPQSSAAAGVHPSTAAAGTPHARVLGVGTYVLGILLDLAAYLWAFFAFGPGGAHLAGSGLSRPMSAYSSWAVGKAFFLLAILLMTFAGWLIAGRGVQLYSAGLSIAEPVHQPGARAGGPGIVAGMLVFCGGVGLIVLVFLTAMHYFGTSPSQVPLPPANGGAPPDYIGWALGGVFQILLLTVMALNGSLVAGRGVRLFLGSLEKR